MKDIIKTFSKLTLVVSLLIPQLSQAGKETYFKNLVKGYPLELEKKKSFSRLFKAKPIVRQVSAELIMKKLMLKPPMSKGLVIDISTVLFLPETSVILKDNVFLAKYELMDTAEGLAVVRDGGHFQYVNYNDPTKLRTGVPIKDYLGGESLFHNGVDVSSKLIKAPGDFIGETFPKLADKLSSPAGLPGAGNGAYQTKLSEAFSDVRSSTFKDAGGNAVEVGGDTVARSYDSYYKDLANRLETGSPADSPTGVKVDSFEKAILEKNGVKVGDDGLVKPEELLEHGEEIKKAAKEQSDEEDDDEKTEVEKEANTAADAVKGKGTSGSDSEAGNDSESGSDPEAGNDSESGSDPETGNDSETGSDSEAGTPPPSGDPEVDAVVKEKTSP